VLFRGLRRTVVVGDHRKPRPFEVVELPRVDRQPECAADGERQHDAQGNEEEEDLHVQRARRSAFATTASELNDMPIPATSGVTIPAAASGIATML
jgi:hypothetical protein